MKLLPYAQVDDTPFTLTVAQLLARCGEPLHRSRNGVALNEYDYGDVVYRFQDGGRLEEVTAQAPVLVMVPRPGSGAGEIAVPFGALGDFLRRHDIDAFERAGFLVSPRYGLAVDPDAAVPWVTALAAHCIATWRSIGGAANDGAT